MVDCAAPGGAAVGPRCYEPFLLALRCSLQSCARSERADSDPTLLPFGSSPGCALGRSRWD